MTQFKRGDMWYVNYSYSVGSEQQAGRPAVIVSNDANNAHSTTLEVVYLTTAPKRCLPTHVEIKSTGRDSVALCEQVSTVSIERIGNYKGRATDEEMANIDKAIAISLGLDFNVAREKKEKPQVGFSFKEVVKEAMKDEPDPAVRIAAAEARCQALEQMYNTLLDKLLKAG